MATRGDAADVLSPRDSHEHLQRLPSTWGAVRGMHRERRGDDNNREVHNDKEIPVSTPSAFQDGPCQSAGIRLSFAAPERPPDGNHTRNGRGSPEHFRCRRRYSRSSRQTGELWSTSTRTSSPTPGFRPDHHAARPAGRPAHRAERVRLAVRGRGVAGDWRTRGSLPGPRGDPPLPQKGKVAPSVDTTYTAAFRVNGGRGATYRAR